jgi:hypothetical protein
MANEGQQRQFDNQRKAQLQDLLISNYRDHLKAAERVAADADLPEKYRSKIEKGKDAVEFSAAEAEVLLIASPELWKAAKLVHQAYDESRPAYVAARNAFIDRALEDIGEVG